MNFSWFPNWLRPRYRLRTLFCAVMAMAIWLAWEINLVRERRALVDSLQQSGSEVFYATEKQLAAGCQIPLVRRLFGDRAVALIWLDFSVRQDEKTLRQVQTIFPESSLGRD